MACSYCISKLGNSFLNLGQATAMETAGMDLTATKVVDSKTAPKLALA